MSFLQSITPLMQASPQEVIPRLRISALLSDIASAEGIDRDAYVLTDAEFQQMQAMQQQAQMQQMANQAAVQQEFNQ